MSVPASPEALAFTELARLVHHLGDELASYRKRALTAEARLKHLDALAARTGADPERAAELEQENEALRQRLDVARERTIKMLDRVRFLRQQHGN